MDKIRAMQTFVRIVEANSFTKAAETLDLPRASLTATLQNLEAFLGTQLLQRTTRRLSLTPDGAQYYKQCIEILNAVETAELSFRGPDAKRPKGTLRVDLPGTLGRNLVLPRIAEFCTAYPEVNLNLSLTDRLVDIMQEGIDCTVRVGHLQDSSMVGRQIGTMRFVICAGPSYLERHGTPRTIQDLQSHHSVVHLSGRTGRAFDWELVVDGKPVKVDLGGPIAVNDADANIACALQGLGLAQAAVYQVRKHLESGALVQVLPDTPPTAMPISLLYPQGRMAAPKLSVFADWLRTLFDGDPAVRLQA
jgi:LysR family transcriptional regulator, regulator for bpeEF and oprC